MKPAVIGIAAAATFLGCIENPEPDPRLHIPRPERAEVVAEYLDSGQPLVFTLTRDSGKVRLWVRNPGWNRVDSMRFLLEMRDEMTMYVPNRKETLFRPQLEYFASVGAIEPGGTAEVGVIDSIPFALSEMVLTSIVFALSVDGVATGGHDGFAFRGSFRRRDSLGNVSQGTVRGHRNHHGHLDVALFPEGSLLAEQSLEVDPSRSGALTGWYVEWPVGSRWSDRIINRPAQGRLHSGTGDPVADFILFDERIAPSRDSLLDPDRHAHDSLHIRIEPYSVGD